MAEFVSLTNTYIFALDEFLRQQFDEYFQQRLVADEKIHDFSKRVLVVIGPKLKIKDSRLTHRPDWSNL